MGERYLYQKCPFLKEVSQERREQFETYFRTAPDWLIDAFVVEKMKSVSFDERDGSLVPAACQSL